MRIIGILAAAGLATAVLALNLTNAEQSKLDKFDKLAVGGVTQVIYKVGKTQSVKIEGNKDLVAATEMVVKKGKLTISQNKEALKGIKLPDKAKVVVTITTPALTALEMTGASSFKGTGFKEDTLTVSSKGASAVKISGTAKNLVASSQGASSIDCTALKSQTGSVTASGAATVKVNVAKSLVVSADGASGVTYSGSPTVSQMKSGVATIHKSKI